MIKRARQSFASKCIRTRSQARITPTFLTPQNPQDHPLSRHHTPAPLSPPLITPPLHSPHTTSPQLTPHEHPMGRTSAYPSAPPGTALPAPPLIQIASHLPVSAGQTPCQTLPLTSSHPFAVTGDIRNVDTISPSHTGHTPTPPLPPTPSDLQGLRICAGHTAYPGPLPTLCQTGILAGQTPSPSGTTPQGGAQRAPECPGSLLYGHRFARTLCELGSAELCHHQPPRQGRTGMRVPPPHRKRSGRATRFRATG